MVLGDDVVLGPLGPMGIYRDLLGPEIEDVPEKWKERIRGHDHKEESGSAFGGRCAPGTRQDPGQDFKARWIAFGMMIKNRADGYGVDWRGKTFEKWLSEITFAEVFAEHKEGVENHA